MREIKFRGKHINAFIEPHNTGIWVYGYLCNDHYINSEELEGEMLVDKDTIGQYTGLHDKDGKEIYEGDIVLYEDCEMSTENGYGDNFINKGVIEYIEENCCFNVTERQTVELSDVLYKDNDTLEVIGNIWDNPELLEG